jgi:hypothetical protein
LTAEEIRSAPASDDLINSLVAASEARVKTNTLMSAYPEVLPFLTHALLALDLFSSRGDNHFSVEDICYALYLPAEASILHDEIEVIQACMEFATEKSILSAEDLLRINDAIQSASTGPLTESRSPYSVQYIEQLRPILHDFYYPEHQYLQLLDVALACYRLLTLSKPSAFSLRALGILFSTVFENKFSFLGFAGQWSLSAETWENLLHIDIESALIHILEAFRQMWLHIGKLIFAINQKRCEVFHLARERFPEYAATRLGPFLSERLCIRNRDILNGTELTTKTVIKHLRYLEQERILRTVKCGTKVFYFNNAFIDMLNQQMAEWRS